MLTDEQARRFCECPGCAGMERLPTYELSGVFIGHRDCARCDGTGIDPAKRKELEELLRAAQESAWSEGYQEGCSDGAAGQWGLRRSPDNPYAKAPTNG